MGKLLETGTNSVGNRLVVAQRPVDTMVREKTLSPSGSKDDDGEYHNAQINITKPELEYSGLDVGDAVHVISEKGRIIIQSKNYDDAE